MSALAVVSLVLAILLGIVALLGLWWVEVLPLLLGLLAIGATGPQKKRGRGLAIAGVVVAVGAGIGTFLVHRGIEIVIEEHLDGLVVALDRGDAAKAGEWAHESVAGDTASPRWIARVAAARERLGPYSGSVRVGSVFLGFLPAMVPPEGVEEVEPRGTDPVALGQAVWARVQFERGVAWVAFVGGDPDKPGSAFEQMKDAEGQKIRPWIRDVRVYLPRDGPSEK
jgi:hypothetical protein